MLYREIIAVCSQIHTKHINTQNVELYIKTQSVPRSKHSVSVIQTSQLMLYREIIAVCSQIHTKHINTQNAELYIKTQSVPRSKLRLCSTTRSIIHIWGYNLFFLYYFPSLYKQIYPAVASHFLTNTQTHFSYITGVLHVQCMAFSWICSS